MNLKMLAQVQKCVHDIDATLNEKFSHLTDDELVGFVELFAANPTAAMTLVTGMWPKDAPAMIGLTFWRQFLRRAELLAMEHTPKDSGDENGKD